MKIYIATPVNGRKEKTLRLKLDMACTRVSALIKYLRQFQFCDEGTEFVSVFTFGTPKELECYEEGAIMGCCVQKVIESDMIVLDDGWESSRGCTIERYVAMQYGKKIQTINWFMLQEVLTEITDKAKEL